MQDKLIDMDTAILAKEKGFNEGCSWFYGIYEGYSGMHLVDNYNKSNDPEEYSVCTQSLLQKWLRDIHDIHISLTRVYKLKNDVSSFSGYCVYIGDGVFESKIPINDFFVKNYYPTYEWALEIGIKESLNLIK